MHDDEVIELVGIARTEEEVRQRDGFLVACVLRAQLASARGCGAVAVAAVVGVLAVDGIEVVDGGEDGLILVAHLVGASTVNTSVVNLGVEDVGVLELWIAALITELRVITDTLHIQTTCHLRIRRQPGNVGFQTG